MNLAHISCVLFAISCLSYFCKQVQNGGLVALILEWLLKHGVISSLVTKNGPRRALQHLFQVPYYELPHSLVVVKYHSLYSISKIPHS